MNFTQKRILIAAIHYPVASGRYLARAFRRLGHDVKTVGPAQGTSVWGMEVDKRHVWEPDFEPKLTLYPSWAQWGEIDAIMSWIPDLVITSDSAYTVRGCPDYLPHVLYGVDNHVRDYELGVEWDYKFLAHSRGYRMEDENSIWLPCGFDPASFRRTTMPWQRPVKAGMVGVMYPARQAVMEALAQEFPPNPMPQVMAALGLLYEDYSDFYNKTLVSVCVSAADDVAQRIFETAAMGCIILSDRCHDFATLGFEEGTHYLGFSTPDEAVSRMKQLLTMPDGKITELAVNAFEWAQNHSWDARCQVILDTVFGEPTQ